MFDLACYSVRKSYITKKYFYDKADYTMMKRREYCKARNKVSKLIKQNRKKFEKDLVDQVKTNPKAIWKYIQSKSTVDDKVKAKILAEFFSSVFAEEPDGPMPQFEKKACRLEMPFIEIMEEKVESLPKDVNPNKSPGLDNLQPRLLKKSAAKLKDPLCRVFKRCLREGKIPDVWKKSRISAIFKNKGNRKVAGNYRPVSLTTIVSKTFEKVVREDIIKHFNDNGLFSKKQYGFLGGRSTSLQLLPVHWSALFSS
eukprot:gene21253-23326_t